MNLTPKSQTDQTSLLLGQTYILWRATPLVAFSDKTSDELLQSLRIHLMDDLDYEVNDGTVFYSPQKPTIMEATLDALRLDDWEKVNMSSQILELHLKIWFPNRVAATSRKLYFLPATTQRQIGGTMVDATDDFPLLLAKIDSKPLSESIQRWLKNDFGCDITKFHVSGGMMTALVNWWTGSLNSTYDYELDGSNLQTKCLELTYFISLTENLNSISFTITMDQLRNMQKLIQDTDLTMMDLIKEHVYKTLRIKMDYCILTRVGTPVAYISNNSQLKLLKNGGSKSQYLNFLSELCDLAGASL